LELIVLYTTLFDYEEKRCCVFRIRGRPRMLVRAIISQGAIVTDFPVADFWRAVSVWWSWAARRSRHSTRRPRAYNFSSSK